MELLVNDTALNMLHDNVSILLVSHQSRHSMIVIQFMFIPFEINMSVLFGIISVSLEPYDLEDF